MRFEDAYTGWRERRLTQEAAAELLGVCDRTFRRHINHFENEGMDRLLDKRMHQVSALCAPVDEVMALEALYRETVRQLDRCPLPRALHGGTQGRAQLLLGEAAAAGQRLGEGGQGQGETSAETGTKTTPWNDAASGWFHAPLAGSGP